MKDWTSERAREIEQYLIGVISQLPTAVQPHGCSDESHKDAKVTFQYLHTGVIQDYFLDYNPDTLRLTYWGGNIHRDSPQDILDYLQNRFPNAALRDDFRPVPGSTRRLNFPYLYPVLEDQLAKVAEIPAETQ